MLKQGRVSECGNCDQLLARDGEFKRMLALQEARAEFCDRVCAILEGR